MSSNPDNFQYIRQLENLVASDQSAGYVKKWARAWLNEINYQEETILKVIKTPARQDRYLHAITV